MEKIPQEQARYLAEAFRCEFVSLCGICVEEIRRGYLESRMEVAKRHEQQNGVVHAGVISTMADHSAGYAAFTVIPEEYEVLTVEYKINFFRPAHADSLLCRARVLKEGGRIMVGESEVFAEAGTEEMLVAKATVTLAVVHKDKMPQKNSAFPE